MNNALCETLNFMKIKGVFITGTDTGVGKTVVSAALLSLLRRSGADAVPMKPVQTGCVKKAGKLLAPDLEFCLGTAALKISAAETKSMAPYCFKKACSPHLAARSAGRKINIKVILAAFKKLSLKHDLVIVEGAGGLLAPLGAGHFMLDLIQAMDLPVILVARTGLGTINHTLLSLRVLRRAEIILAGIIFSKAASGPWQELEKDNIRTIEALGRIRVLGHVPFIPALNHGGTPGTFARSATAYLPAAKKLMAYLEKKG